VGRRRRTPRHEDEQRLKSSPEQQPESKDDPAGPRRADSPQAGVARLAEVAGNQAVAGMLQRFLDGEQEQVEEGGGGGRAFEPIVQQEEQPTAPVEQQGGGGDQFTIADDVDGGTGGGGGDRFVIGENVDGGAAGQVTAETGPQDFQAEMPTREERAQAREARGGGGASVPRGGGGVLLAQQLRGRALAKLGEDPLQARDPRARDLTEQLADAVGRAWVTWQSAASIVGVFINGPTANGGQVVGPPLSSLIMSEAAGVDVSAARALSDAIGSAHATFTAILKMLGNPVFPSFAAMPSPVAPPTPSIPVPVSATSANIGPFFALERGVALQDPRKRQEASAASAVARAMPDAVAFWMPLALVNLLGTGPVPTFAPPYVPVGPVIGGVANSPPGGIIGG